MRDTRCRWLFVAILVLSVGWSPVMVLAHGPTGDEPEAAESIESLTLPTPVDADKENERRPSRLSLTLIRVPDDQARVDGTAAGSAADDRNSEGAGGGTGGSFAGSVDARVLLTDEDGEGLAGGKVIFFRRTTFGRLTLGTVPTDRDGIATVRMQVYPGQEVEVTAVFAGDATRAPADSTATLSLPDAPAAQWPRTLTQRADARYVTVLVLVVGGIWAAYAYVASLVVQIGRHGVRHS